MKKKRVTKKGIIWIIIAVLLAGAVAGFAVYNRQKAKKAQAEVEIVETEATVERRNIMNSISGTSVVAPKDSYEIKSLVSGDVIFAGFEKGDVVRKDDILYRIDASDTEKNLTSAGNSLKRSQKSYDNAVEDLKDLTIVSDYTGKVSNLAIKKGDKVSQNMVVARIYDDTKLDVTVPFVELDANNIFVGQTAMVSIANSATTVGGVVIEVMSSPYYSASHVSLKDVTVRIDNPGAVTVEDTATVQIDNMYCNNAGKFEYITEENISSDATGEVKEIYVSDGDYIYKGQTIAVLENDSMTDAIENARLSLNDSQLNYEKAQDSLDNYTIKAPISGTVIEKNYKVGDTLDSSKSSTESLAIIYDMSALTFDMSIDETDIKDVEVGQSVTITAEAVEGKKYMGMVTNVSVVGTTNYGITSYPVTVEITEFDEDLLPGMNIEAVINISKADNVISVPISAINRGNTVYVKGEKTDEGDKAPDGFKTVRVETGVSDGAFVEIKSGLNEGDVVKVITVISTKQETNPFMMGGGMGAGMGGMPGGNMSGGMRQGGSMSGGMRQGGNMSGGMR